MRGAPEQAGDGHDLQVSSVHFHFQFGTQVGEYGGHVGQHGFDVDGFAGLRLYLTFQAFEGEQFLDQVVEFLQGAFDALEIAVLFFGSGRILGIVDQEEQAGQGSAQFVGDGVQQFPLPIDEAGGALGHLVEGVAQGADGIVAGFGCAAGELAFAELPGHVSQGVDAAFEGAQQVVDRTADDHQDE